MTWLYVAEALVVFWTLGMYVMDRMLYSMEEHGECFVSGRDDARLRVLAVFMGFGLVIALLIADWNDWRNDNDAELWPLIFQHGPLALLRIGEIQEAQRTLKSLA